MTGDNVTAIGLALDIIGALLLWKYVVEISFVDKESYLKGRGSLDVTDPTPEQIQRYKRNIALSRTGIGLLIAGFFLQLIGNYVQ